MVITQKVLSRRFRRFHSSSRRWPSSLPSASTLMLSTASSTGCRSSILRTTVSVEAVRQSPSSCRHSGYHSTVAGSLQKVRGVNSGLYPQSVERGGSGLFGMLTLGARADSTCPAAHQTALWLSLGAQHSAGLVMRCDSLGCDGHTTGTSIC